MSIPSVQYQYKSTTAFDDQYGFEAQELSEVIPDGVFQIDAEAIERARNTITFHAGGPANTEMLRVSPEGFWVRGVKVEQDDGEAKKVYEAFKQWMIWAELNRR